jgi:hypothetical protein
MHYCIYYKRKNLQLDELCDIASAMKTSTFSTSFMVATAPPGLPFPSAVMVVFLLLWLNDSL